MRAASLGDDVYGLDPTVNQLQEMSAELLGKEAALFMPSGTMANLTALLAHTRPGDEVVLETEAHILFYETGGLSALANLVPLPIPGDRGVLRPEAIEPRLRDENIHYPRTTLLWIENTHNRAGGTITDEEAMPALRSLCDRRGLALHVDGARIFNAAVALGVPAESLVRAADSVAVSLSKGLSAPVGSMLAGSGSFVARAKRVRKMLGGAMRQAGVVAAASILALEAGIARVAEDHERARRLSSALAGLPA